MRPFIHQESSRRTKWHCMAVLPYWKLLQPFPGTDAVAAISCRISKASASGASGENRILWNCNRPGIPPSSGLPGRNRKPDTPDTESSSRRCAVPKGIKRRYPDIEDIPRICWIERPTKTALVAAGTWSKPGHPANPWAYDGA